MRKTYTVVLFALAVVGLISISFHSSFAANTAGWEEPVKLFEAENAIFEPAIVADNSGKVHIFFRYSEPLKIGQPFSDMIYYIGWNGERWTTPRDVLMSPDGSLTFYPDATIDSTGMLHVIWVGSRVFYSHVASDQASRASAWSEPQPLSATGAAPVAAILASSDDELYVAFSQKDVYVIKSNDGGKYWTEPVNVSLITDPMIATSDARLALDESGCIHAIWTELTLPTGEPPRGVVYSKSCDAGETWSIPFKLMEGRYVEGNIIASGNKIHAVWNGRVSIGGRYHRWSMDGGETWTDVEEVFPKDAGGGMEGFPGLAVDSAGTIHLVLNAASQMWYRSWNSSTRSWSPLENITLQILHLDESPSASGFFLTEDSRMTIGEGNILHLVFWTKRSQLWYTRRTTDASHVHSDVATFPNTVPTPTPTQQISMNVSPNIKVMSSSKAQNKTAIKKNTVKVSPYFSIVLGVLMALMVIISVVFVQIWQMD